MSDSLEKSIDSIRKKEEEELVLYLSKKYNIPYISKNAIVEPSALLMLKEKEAKDAKIALFKKRGDVISAAVRRPEDKQTILLIARLERNGYKVKRFFATNSSLEKFWSYYADLRKAEKTRVGIVSISAEQIQKVKFNIKIPSDLNDIYKEKYNSASKTSISELIEIIIGAALALRASDIHLEPFKNSVDIRFRIDGILVVVLSIEHKIAGKIKDRFKLVSGMKINIKKEAQDGRFTLQLKEGDTELRVSLVPSSFGESIVMRILDPSKNIANLEEIGLHPKLLALCKREINKLNGMLITTGPTGSGKTTSIYSFLKHIHKPDKKIFTLENPVEYKLRGIVQTQINSSYSFIDGLKAALRQDPDVILIGEIRDSEVAKTAFDAALTGHFVFSTLHTNDAVGALPRLVGLGVDSKILSSAMNLILAQRLVRKLCKNCVKKTILIENEKKEIEKLINSAPPETKEELTSIGLNNIKEVDTSKTCSNCFNGYKGVTGIFEVVLVTKEIEKIMVTTGSISDLREEVYKNGFPSLSHDCLLKVLTGITSIDELERTTGQIIKVV